MEYVILAVTVIVGLGLGVCVGWVIAQTHDVIRYFEPDDQCTLLGFAASRLAAIRSSWDRRVANLIVAVRNASVTRAYLSLLRHRRRHQVEALPGLAASHASCCPESRTRHTAPQTEGVRRLLHAYDSVQLVARAAQADRERLQQQCESLRKEITKLQAEVKRLQKERAESARTFATRVREATGRSRIAPPLG